MRDDLRPAIQLFTPLPPARSGIADYSADLLPGIERLFPVTVCTEGTEPPVPGALALYQMGNNHYHAHIYQRALEMPGLVVLHDYLLHHLLGEITLRIGDADTYLATLAYGDGATGAAAATSRLMGVFGEHQQFHFPANALLCDRSLAVIVHNRDAQARVHRAHPDLPVHHVPMGVPAVPDIPPTDVAAARKRLGIATDAFVVANFGFVSPPKRLDRLARAFKALLGRAARSLLLVVGEVLPGGDIEGIIASLGIDSRTIRPGYVTREQWTDYLVASDVCVNLRYPTAGETSASLIRILSYGKPVLASRYRQFRELPAAAAGFIDLGPAEEEILAGFLIELEANHELRDRMGRAAREYARQEHSIERALDGYRVAIEETWRARAELRQRVAARRHHESNWRRTSRVPGVLRARIRGQVPEIFPAGSSHLLRVLIENRGDTLWLRNRHDGMRCGFVVLQAAFRRADATSPERWFDLPSDVPPGGRCKMSIAVQAPPMAGRYEIELDMHAAGFGPFAALGDTPRRLPVRVA